MKTSELIGLPLDWAVAEARGLSPGPYGAYVPCAEEAHLSEPFHPSTKGAHGDPIIEEYGIAVGPSPAGLSSWVADLPLQPTSIRDETRSSGPTRLVAAMRCWLAFKVGDTIDIPEELCA